MPHVRMETSINVVASILDLAAISEPQMLTSSLAVIRVVSVTRPKIMGLAAMVVQTINGTIDLIKKLSACVSLAVDAPLLSWT